MLSWGKLFLLACLQEGDQILAIGLLLQPGEDHFGTFKNGLIISLIFKSFTGNHLLWIDQVLVDDFLGPDDARV